MSLSSSQPKRDEPALPFSVKPMSVEPTGSAPSAVAESETGEEVVDPAHDIPTDPILKEPEETRTGEKTESEESTAPSATEVSGTGSEKTVKPTRAARIWGALLDTLLVLMVGGVIGGGGLYLHKEWNKYRVPTVMELTQKQCLDLCAQREALQDAANHADEQLRMRRMISHLSNRLRDFSAKNDRLRASIADQRNRVLALQHEIRQADREARGVALSLLPGLPVGNVTTKRGRTYDNASIVRLQGKRVSLRTPDGAATLFLNEISKDNLPDLVLYALGEIDRVDTTDFTSDGEAPTVSKTNTKLHDVSPAKKKPTPATDYEEPRNGPVVDTDANRTSTSTGGGDLPAPRSGSDDVWQPPTGDLPL